MKVAIFSDIHSNLEALLAVLEDMNSQGVTHRICLGDIVGYSADPSECVREIKSLACATLKGNHDEQATSESVMEGYNELARESLFYSRENLEPSQKQFLNSLPYQLQFSDSTFVHSCLYQPQNWIYVLSYREASLNFENQTTPIAFCGHTHFPLIFENNTPLRAYHTVKKMRLNKRKRYLINVGSVGQPRDGDNRSCYGIYDDEENMFEFRRVPYDIEKATGKIIRAGLSPILAARLRAAM